MADIFLRGDTNPDWVYILWDVVFGFRVTNPSCNVNYNIEAKKIRNRKYRDIINEKLLSELHQGMISRVDTAPQSTIASSVYPKVTGDVRLLTLASLKAIPLIIILLM